MTYSPTTHSTSVLQELEKLDTSMSSFKQEIEDLGTFFEGRGMTPMEARVFSLLLLSEPHYQDFFSIQEELSASKSSISNALNRLMISKRVDYRTLPGDRKRYFKINPSFWLEKMKVEIASVVPMMRKIEAILAKRAAMNTPEFNKDLERVHGFFAFMADEFPKIMAKWERLDAKTKGA